MNSSGLEVIDTTVQTANIWLNEIGETVGGDKQRSYHALRGVLFALRDRLTTEEAFHVSAQLPLLVRGIYWEGYRSAEKPERLRTRDEFLQKVSKGFGQIGPMNAEMATRAVFAVLDQHLSRGEVDEVKQTLPEPIRTLFPGSGH